MERTRRATAPTFGALTLSSSNESYARSGVLSDSPLRQGHVIVCGNLRAANASYQEKYCKSFAGDEVDSAHPQWMTHLGNSDIVLE